MDVYLVRHGETEYNRRHVHQHPGVPLNEKGRQQIKKLVPTIKRLQPTHLLVSPHTRTRESAEILATDIGLEPIPVPDLVEIYRPKKVQGVRYTNYRSFIYLLLWFFSGLKKYNNDEKGESYASLIERIERAKDQIQQLPEDSRVVVVSHAVFISFFTAHLCDAKPMSAWRSFTSFMNIRKLKNSSVTHLRYTASDNSNVCQWSLQEFDDTEHLKA